MRRQHAFGEDLVDRAAMFEGREVAKTRSPGVRAVALWPNRMTGRAYRSGQSAAPRDGGRLGQGLAGNGVYKGESDHEA